MVLYRWGYRNPFEELLRAQREMSRVMQTMSEGEVPGNLPPVNVYDDGDNFYLRAEIAGIDRSKLDISVAGDVLTVSAERHLEEPHGSYHRRERNWDRFSRSITLPDTIDVNKVNASYKNGVLEVTLPRAAEVKPKRITIEA